MRKTDPMPPTLHIIVTRDGIILVRGQEGETFRDFQSAYDGFLTSLGPFDRDGVLDTFENEWPDLLVMNHDTIRAFTSEPSAPGARGKRAEVRIAMNAGPP